MTTRRFFYALPSGAFLPSTTGLPKGYPFVMDDATLWVLDSDDGSFIQVSGGEGGGGAGVATEDALFTTGTGLVDLPPASGGVIYPIIPAWNTLVGDTEHFADSTDGRLNIVADSVASLLLSMDIENMVYTGTGEIALNLILSNDDTALGAQPAFRAVQFGRGQSDFMELQVVVPPLRFSGGTHISMTGFIQLGPDLADLTGQFSGTLRAHWLGSGS